MQLHKRDPKREVVVAAAAILDSYGIADLTMRRLARELDVTPGALYWHFASKQELLGAVADHVLDPVRSEPTGAAATSWRRRIVVVCTRFREALLSHTDGAELVSASFAAGQSRRVTQVLESLADTAAEAGLGREQAAMAARSLLYYVLGATADEQSRRRWDVAGGPADPVAGFEFGLRLLVDGLAAQSAANQMFATLVALPPS